MTTTPTWRNATAAARLDCDHTHVATSYDRVAAAAIERAETHYPGDARVRAAVVTAYLIRHRANRAEYAQVMG
jgi:hypothetical protein